MTDPIPSPIYQRIKEWLAKKEACQVTLHVNGDGKIVQADRIVKERVTGHEGGAWRAQGLAHALCHPVTVRVRGETGLGRPPGKAARRCR